MFEDKTTEAIKESILQTIRDTTNLSTMAGSFADAMAGPVSEELSEAYHSLPGVTSMLFVDEGSGPYIDQVGYQYWNLVRRPGTYATGTITLTGDPGTALAIGASFLTADGLEFRLLQDITIGTSGVAQGGLQAALVGSAYNLEKGALVRMYVNPVGLTGYHSGETAGGTDMESDKDLLARIDERRKRPPTSGNGYHYRAWAMAVPGVGNAKVVETPAGPGTVGVTIIDSNYDPAVESIVEAVWDNIEAQRPVGAGVTVASATALEVDIAATVALAPGVTPEQVRERFLLNLEAYRRELIKPKYDKVYFEPEEDLPYLLLYNRVSALLITTPGVQNYTTLTINNGEADISIPHDRIPVITEVVIEV